VERKRNRGQFDRDRAAAAAKKRWERTPGQPDVDGGDGVGHIQNERSRLSQEPSDGPNLDPETELRKLASDSSTPAYVRSRILSYLDQKERTKPEPAPAHRPGRGTNLFLIIETLGASFGFEEGDVVAAFRRGRSRRVEPEGPRSE
jgi:hypothetical protein